MKTYQNYRDEIINTRGNIILAIFAVFDLFVIIILFKQFFDGEYDIGILLLSLILFLPFFLVPVYAIFINIVNGKKNQEKVQEIINNGVKVNGTIIDIIKKYVYEDVETYFKNAGLRGKYREPRNSFGLGDKYYEIAVVEYEYLQEKHIVESPALNINTYYLDSKDVDVYIYNNECYIDNYKLNIKKINKDK